MAASRPRVRIREAVPADARIMADIESAAYGENVMGRLINPPPVSEESKAKRMAGYFPPEGNSKPNAEMFLMVAELLPEAGPVDAPVEIVAWAKWILRREPMPEGEWNIEQLVTAEMVGEGTNVEAFNWYITALHRTLRGIVRGEPHLYLKGLTCAPTHQRLGAGSALVRWGLDIADRLGLATYLEASPVGYPLYRKLGFEDVLALDFNVTEKWGVVWEEGQNWGQNNALQIGGELPSGYTRAVIMKRPAKATSS